MTAIVILTDISPGENKNGPSSLLAEIIRQLDHARIIKLNKPSIFNKLGIYIKKCNYEADLILCYPSHVFYSLDTKARNKAVVIAPDSATLLYKRFAQISNNLMAIKYNLLFFWFLYFERTILASSRAMCVVGKVDLKFMKIIHKNRVQNLHYILHPCFSGLHPRDWRRREVMKECSQRLILCGDLSLKYLGKGGISTIYAVVTALPPDIEIIVTGIRNYWIFSFIKSAIPSAQCKYHEWVDNYSDLCSKNDIHLVPLFAGAGTKNRVLTALSFGCKVIGTNMAFENTGSASFQCFRISRSGLNVDEEFTGELNRFIQRKPVNKSVGENYFLRRSHQFSQDLNSILRLRPGP